MIDIFLKNQVFCGLFFEIAMKLLWFLMYLFLAPRLIQCDISFPLEILAFSCGTTHCLTWLGPPASVLATRGRSSTRGCSVALFDRQARTSVFFTISFWSYGSGDVAQRDWP